MTVDEPLDPAVLGYLRKLEDASGERILAQLVAAFIAVTPQRFAMVHAAIVAGNAHAVHQAAHSLKGSSASLGARRMAQLCGDLEVLGRTNDLAHVAGILAKIEVEFIRVRTALAYALEHR